MKTAPDHLLLTFIAVASLLAGPATAASVFVNSPVAIPGTGTAVAGFKLRASTTNWDLAISNQGGTPTAADYVAANVTNSFSGGGGENMKFTLQNIPGQGFVLTTVRTQGSGRSTTSVAWGTFTPTILPTALAASLNGLTPGAAFNTLALDAQSLFTGSSLRLKDLLFTAPGLTVNGNFNEANLADSGVNTNGQFVVADTNLAGVAWTLSGSVTIQRPNTGGGDEQVRFTITARQGGLISTPVPESATAMLCAAGLAGMTMRRRRA